MAVLETLDHDYIYLDSLFMLYVGYFWRLYPEWSKTVKAAELDENVAIRINVRYCIWPSWWVRKNVK